MNIKSKLNKLLPLLLIGIFSFIFMVLADVIITPITPLTNITTSNSSVLIQMNVSTDYMKNLTWKWDGTDYVLYDPSLVLFMNFDNRSSLSECTNNLTGCVKDLSRYGNNGTLVGSWYANGTETPEANISWTPNGKYGGAFNFSGGVNYVNISDSDSLANNYTSMTWSFWIKDNSISSYASAWIDKYNNGGNQRSYRIVKNYGGVSVNLADNLLSGTTYLSSNTCGSENNKWIKLDIIYNGTALFWFKNGDLCYINNSVTQTKIINNNYNLFIGYSIGAGTYLNGSIDDVMIFNRSLSANEISQLYKSQLTKYDNQNWSFQNNASDYAILKDYQLCSSNSTTQICSVSNSIRGLNTITTNFTTSIGKVNNNFYGISSYVFGSNTSIICNKQDCSSILSSDYLWHRTGFENAGINFHRMDMQLEDLSTGEGTWASFSSLTNENILTHKDKIKYIHDNDGKIMLIANFMPDWLANQTSGWCNVSNQANANFSCPPSNYTKWTNLIIDYLNQTDCDLYPETCYVEAGNEPNIQDYYLNNISNRTNPIISIEYNKLCNATLQIKNIYPNIKVGCGSATVTSGRNEIISAVLSNFSNDIDFYSPHIYKTTQNATIDTRIYYDSEFAKIKSDITTYGFTREIIIGEIRNANSSILDNQTSENIKDDGLIWLYGLNYNISSLMPWEWAKVKSFNATVERKWEFVSEPNLDNTYLNGYNVTKNFAHLCPAGSTVYQSSSDDDTIKVVTCKKGLQRSVIVINTDTVSKNVTANLTSSGITTLSNYLDNSETYTASGSTNLGIMDSYDILYLTEDLQSPTITINSPTSSTYTTTSIDFNITLDEEGDTCIYSLNNFLTNYSMAKQGWVQEFKASQILTLPDDNDYTASFWCNDTSGNVGTNQVIFSLSVCPHYQEIANDGSCQDTVESGCNTFTRTAYKLVMIFASLILLSFCSYFVWRSYQNGDLTVGKLIVFFVIIIVCIALWLASGQSLGASCGVVG